MLSIHPVNRELFFGFRFKHDGKIIRTCLLALIPVPTDAILHIKQQHLIDHESWE